MISIIIPLYNKQDCIKRTIYSVIRQDFEDFEIVVVDDGSTDSSGKVVNEIPDERVKYFHKDNQGGSAARNFGLSLAKGEWVLFLDADDVLKEHALSVFKAAVIENPDVEVFVSGYSVLVDGKEQDRPCPMEGCCDKPLKYYWRGYFFPRTGNTLLSKNAALSISHFDERMSFNEDFAVVLKMLEFYKVFIIPVSCMVYTDDYNTLSARNTDVFKEFIAYAHTVSLENKYIRRIIFNHYKYSLARRRKMKDDDGYCYLKMNFDTLFSFWDKIILSFFAKCNIVIRKLKL